MSGTHLSTEGELPDDAENQFAEGTQMNAGQYATQTLTINADSEVRREELFGEEYLVAPVTAVREMVLKDEFLEFDEIKRTAQAWNGTLMTLGHPKQNGGHVPASVPKRFHEYGIGWLFNVNAISSDRKLDGEAWINIQASKEAAVHFEKDNPVEAIQTEGEDLEVSTGYWYDRESTAGHHNNEEFVAKQRNIKPDHLATLPESIGECSVEDGCGITVNQCSSGTCSCGEHTDVTETAINKSIDGISFQGTKGGKLDEGNIPEDDFESHYVFDEDTKSASSFPLVDGDGMLRKGNVASAFNLRGHAEDEDKLLSVLRAANKEFDSPPMDEEDFENNEGGMLKGLKSFLGWQSEENESPAETEDNSESGEQEEAHMSDRIENLAERTRFDEDALQAMEEEQLDTLEETLEDFEEQEEDEEDEDSDSESNEEEETNSEQVEGIEDNQTNEEENEDVEELESQVSEITDTVNDLANTVNSLSDEVTEVKEVQNEVEEKVTAQERQELDGLKTKVAAHSEFDKEDLPDDKDHLETLKEEVKPRGGFGGATATINEEEDSSDIALGLNEARQESD
jgi:hypothetical protein